MRFYTIVSNVAIALMVTIGCFVGVAPVMAQSAAPAKSQMPSKAAKKLTIVQTAIASPQLENLVRLLQSAKLVDALNGKGPFTVFAPTNLATSLLATNPNDPASVRELVEKLEKDPAALANLLKYHVVMGKFPAQSLRNGVKLVTLNGQKLTIRRTGDGKVTLVTSSGSVAATVITPNIEAKNGIVHIIDRVLIPKAKGATPNPAPTPKPDVKVEPAPETPLSPKLSTLTGVVKNLGLDKVLTAPGKIYTVFSPDNQAFANLSYDPHNPDRVKSDLDALFSNTPVITKVITNHVVEGSYLAKDLHDGQLLTTLEGGQIKIIISNGVVKVMDVSSGSTAVVTGTDIMTPNGPRHVISEVLLP